MLPLGCNAAHFRLNGISKHAEGVGEEELWDFPLVVGNVVFERVF